MPIQRKHKPIPAIQSLVELLIGMQFDERLIPSSTPDWAIGTSVEEIFQALRILGNGEWLDGRYQGFGIYDNADRWLRDFFDGKPVPTWADATEEPAAANGKTLR